MIAAGYASMALTSEYFIVLGVFVGGAGIGTALMGVSSMAIQVDIGRRLGMATIMSFASTAFAAGVLAGSLAAGVIADGAGTKYVFLSASVAILLCMVVFLARTARPQPLPTSATP